MVLYLFYSYKDAIIHWNDVLRRQQLDIRKFRPVAAAVANVHAQHHLRREPHVCASRHNVPHDDI